MRARKVVDVAPVTSTATIAPGSARPATLTVTFCRVRPRRRLPSRLAPSMSTSTRRPTQRRRPARASSCVSAIRRCTLSRLTSSATWPSRSAAAVPAPRRVDEREGAVEAASPTRDSVAAKSSSVSPGKPTMRSVVRASPGPPSRRRAHQVQVTAGGRSRGSWRPGCGRCRTAPAGAGARRRLAARRRPTTRSSRHVLGMRGHEADALQPGDAARRAQQAGRRSGARRRRRRGAGPCRRR